MSKASPALAPQPLIAFLRTDLPVGHDASGRFLPWLVAIMVFLATLGLAGAMALDGMVTRWSRDASGVLTVQVPLAPGNGEAADRETANRVERAVRLLTSTPGVLSAVPVSPEHLAALLGPWLGSAELVAELPVPRLIDVRLDPAQMDDARALGLDDLGARLAEAVPGALVDDHRVWLSRLIRLAEGLALLAWAVIALVSLACAATVIHATRTALAVHRPHIEVLHLIGATDTYIARQFARRALVHGVVGGLLGLGLAAPALWAMGRLFERLQGGLIPPFTLGPLTWGLIALLPVASGLLAMGAARRTVRRTLARML